MSNLKKKNLAKNKSYLFRIKNTRMIELIVIFICYTYGNAKNIYYIIYIIHLL